MHKIFYIKSSGVECFMNVKRTWHGLLFLMVSNLLMVVKFLLYLAYVKFMGV